MLAETQKLLPPAERATSAPILAEAALVLDACHALHVATPQLK